MIKINLQLINKIKVLSFYLALGIIILIFIFNQILAIWFAGIFFIIYFLSYLNSASSKRRLLRDIKDYLIISDKEIADKLQRSLNDIRKILYKLSKNQKKKKWLIVFLNNRYIFLNEKGVENFKEVYEQGYNEKKILESLKDEMRLRSRAEVRAIQTALANQNRINYTTLEYK